MGVPMNDELLYHMHKFVLPSALALLPGRMDSPEARAMLLAIGLQESGFNHRRQVNGPARGFWQFEKNGTRGVLTHPGTSPVLVPVMHTLRYSTDLTEVFAALEHNDTLACIFARLLLWTSPHEMPSAVGADAGWNIYLQTWRPGKPRHDDWGENFQAAWEMLVP